MDSNALNAVAEWMSQQGLGDGPLEDVSEIGGGTQNIMLRFTRSGRPYVLRRGPKHLRPRSNIVIMRETQVLAALAGTDVPHPRLIASCDDLGVLGDAVFYLMQPIDGFNAGQELPALHAGDPAVRFQMGLSMADALAKLGAVDHAAVGLGDFGKPEGFLERQVPRWLSEQTPDESSRSAARTTFGSSSPRGSPTRCRASTSPEPTGWPVLSPAVSTAKVIHAVAGRFPYRVRLGHPPGLCLRARCRVLRGGCRRHRRRAAGAGAGPAGQGSRSGCPGGVGEGQHAPPPPDQRVRRSPSGSVRHSRECGALPDSDRAERLRASG